jgi:hypothetical protein
VYGAQTGACTASAGDLGGRGAGGCSPCLGPWPRAWGRGGGWRRAILPNGVRLAWWPHAAPPALPSWPGASTAGRVLLREAAGAYITPSASNAPPLPLLPPRPAVPGTGRNGLSRGLSLTGKMSSRPKGPPPRRLAPKGTRAPAASGPRQRGQGCRHRRRRRRRRLASGQGAGAAGGRQGRGQLLLRACGTSWRLRRRAAGTFLRGGLQMARHSPLYAQQRYAGSRRRAGAFPVSPLLAWA